MISSSAYMALLEAMAVPIQTQLPWVSMAPLGGPVVPEV